MVVGQSVVGGEEGLDSVIHVILAEGDKLGWERVRVRTAEVGSSSLSLEVRSVEEDRLNWISHSLTALLCTIPWPFSGGAV
jgi:hypothetical protein